jgi:proline iminopeptidase
VPPTGQTTTWQEHRLKVPDHEMAWYEAGDGPPVVFLHGSFDHLLYRPLAELFTSAHRCILYDQRGAGASVLDAPDERTMHVDRFAEDLEALRTRLGLDRLVVAGHSWGANLALLYAGRFAKRVERLVLLAPGPMTAEMHRVYKANVARMIPPADRDRWPEVNGAYRSARASGCGVPPGVDEANIRLWSPVMFYSAARAEAFVGEYLAAGGWRRHAPDATGFRREACLEAAETIACPTLVVYGYQDYEPIVQAYLLGERMPQAQLLFLHECGHVIWRDRPEALRTQAEAFLGGQPVAENA